MEVERAECWQPHILIAVWHVVLWQKHPHAEQSWSNTDPREPISSPAQKSPRTQRVLARTKKNQWLVSFSICVVRSEGRFGLVYKSGKKKNNP